MFLRSITAPNGVLVSRSKEEEHALKQALQLLKELISSVDQEVLELDRTRRLQEIQARLDPRALAEVQEGGVFRAGELLRRKLLHEGTLLWKVQGSRMKDVQVLLMSDILVFLQEKDQKFTFAALDKSPVVSLNNLIVRDIANQERGMYLISASTPPEMYELYASSKDDRKTWMSRIQQIHLHCLLLRLLLCDGAPAGASHFVLRPGGGDGSGGGREGGRRAGQDLLQQKPVQGGHSSCCQSRTAPPGCPRWR
uniref:PH domain-containing protein n=1 Tax=Oryzias melastigma TaxID=30732 RepID=A0A3B3CU62_ORYME